MKYVKIKDGNSIVTKAIKEKLNANNGKAIISLKFSRVLIKRVNLKDVLLECRKEKY